MRINKETLLVPIVLLAVIPSIYLGIHFILNSKTKKIPSIPIQVQMSQSSAHEFEEPLKEAVLYINESIGKTIFTFSEGKSVMPVYLRTEMILLDNYTDCESCLGYVLDNPHVVILKPKMNDFIKTTEVKKILIAHELLHFLGFPHQSVKHDSLLNEGEALTDKITHNVNYARKIFKELPDYDKDMIKKSLK